MEQNYFEIFMHGEYFAMDGDKKTLRPYKASFKLPNADKPLSVILKNLLPGYLRNKDAAYLDYYSHTIDEIQCRGRKLEPNEIPIRFLSRQQLKEYCAYFKLPVDVEDYGELGLLRQHVRLAKEEPELFKKVAEKYKKRQAEEVALYELNPHAQVVRENPEAKIAEQEPVKPALEPDKPKRASKKKKKTNEAQSGEELLS